MHSRPGIALLSWRSASLYVRYYSEFELQVGTQQFLGDVQNYPLLGGMKPNLYKCFVCTSSWGHCSPELGSVALLHPDGVYEDPTRADTACSELYARLRFRFQFINEGLLFPEVSNHARYGINIYAKRRRPSRFLSISSLIHPGSIDESFIHDGLGELPGIKDEHDNFILRGHRNRVIATTEQELALYALLYDEPGTPAECARLPMVHSAAMLEVLRAIAQSPRLGPVGDRWGTTREWNEGDRQADGTLSRETEFPSDAERLTISGPHIHVATPFNKTPNEVCNTNRAYTSLDLTVLPPDYLPRTTYVISCSEAEYRERAPKWKNRPIFSFYRSANRKMVTPTGERTLVPALIPPGVSTTGGVLTAAFADEREMVWFNGLASSLLVDFFVRSTGRTDVYPSLLQQLPLPPNADDRVIDRCLRLNCLTTLYADLWARVGVAMDNDGFTKDDARLCDWHIESQWRAEVAFRTDYERRQAIVELDVLASMSLGASLEHLEEVFRIQFPVLAQYERERLYDQHGRTLPASKTASGNPAVSLVELGTTLKEQAGFDVHAEYHPDGSNTQELRMQKIRLGKKEADVLGVSARCTMADLLAETEVRWSDEDHPEGRPVRLVGLRYTDPGLEPRMERVYPTPWTRCDREADYRQAWAEFERRLGPKMSQGTPL